MTPDQDETVEKDEFRGEFRPSKGIVDYVPDIFIMVRTLHNGGLEFLRLFTTGKKHHPLPLRSTSLNRNQTFSIGMCGEWMT